MTTRFSYSGTELDAMAEAENYYRAIVAEFEEHIGARVVEAGAGIGTFAEHLLSSTNASEIILVEPALNNFPHLQQRFAENSCVQVVHGYLEDITTASVDTIVAVNVLEHIADDVAFLPAAHEAL